MPVIRTTEIRRRSAVRHRCTDQIAVAIAMNAITGNGNNNWKLIAATLQWASAAPETPNRHSTIQNVGRSSATTSVGSSMRVASSAWISEITASTVCVSVIWNAAPPVPVATSASVMPAKSGVCSAAMAYTRMSRSLAKSPASSTVMIGLPARMLSVTNTIDRDRRWSRRSKRRTHDASPSPISELPPSFVPCVNSCLCSTSNVAESASVSAMYRASSVSGKTETAEPLKIVRPIRSPSRPAVRVAKLASTSTSSWIIEPDTSRHNMTSRFDTSRSSRCSLSGRIVSPIAARPTSDSEATSTPTSDRYRRRSRWNTGDASAWNTLAIGAASSS